MSKLAIEGADRDHVEVIGDGVDSVCLTGSLRRKLGFATIYKSWRNWTSWRRWSSCWWWGGKANSSNSMDLIHNPNAVCSFIQPTMKWFMNIQNQPFALRYVIVVQKRIILRYRFLFLFWDFLFIYFLFRVCAFCYMCFHMHVAYHDLTQLYWTRKRKYKSFWWTHLMN